MGEGQGGPREAPQSISSAWVDRAGWWGRWVRLCGLLGPQAHTNCAGARTRGPWAGEMGRLAFSPGSGCLICGPLPGFSITQLQRKQAMLNASKQQAIGKPKGKRVMASTRVFGGAHCPSQVGCEGPLRRKPALQAPGGRPHFPALRPPEQSPQVSRSPAPYADWTSSVPWG